MIDYRSYSVDELAADEMFKRWILAPTPEISHFWKCWLDENPQRSHTVVLARNLVLSIQEMHADKLTEADILMQTGEISRLVAERQQMQDKRIFHSQTIWRMAAAFVLVSGLTLAYYALKPAGQMQPVAQSLNIPADDLITQTNSYENEMTVLLSDNSIATLSKGSSITFPRNFEARERKVHLTGEAFFDVARNPASPFLVFTNETVTKVLGTSFRVTAFDDEATVLVAVKTGRVSVYPMNDYNSVENEQEEDKNGIVLTPNQQAVFLRKEKRMERSMVAKPEILIESVAPKDQVFEERPVAEVLQSIEKMYGIQIRYDANLLAQCMITAQFSDENLRQRISAICQAIGAGYDMEGGLIVINSKGCN